MTRWATLPDLKTIKAKARPLKKHKMNKTEKAWADRLELRRHGKEIVWWAFEPVKFRLADNTTYTPDFVAVNSNGFIEVHEIKGGHIQDDSRVKFKVAAKKYWFLRWWMVQKTKTDWKTVYDL